MALGLVESVRLRIGDTEKSPFYPLLSDDDIEYFLEASNDNIYFAAQQAATAAYAVLCTIPTRERVGDVEVWNDISKNYANFLKIIINQSPLSIYNTIANPYGAGISWDDMLTNYNNTDVVKSKLSLLDTDCNYVEKEYI